MEILNFELKSKLKKRFAEKYNGILKVGIFENYLKLQKGKGKIKLIHPFSKKTTEWENSFELLNEYILAESKKTNISNIILKRLYLLDLSKKTSYYLKIKIEKNNIICTDISGKYIYFDLYLNEVK